MIEPASSQPCKYPAPEMDLIIANIHYDVMKTLIFQDNFYMKKWEHDGTWHTFCNEIY